MKQAWLAFSLLFFSSHCIAASEMPLATNLAETAKQAQAKKIPIAILLVYHGLKSGQVLKEEVIEPALLGSDYDGLVLFREIRVNEETPIIDFYGETMTAKEFRSLFNITSLPAMVFVDSEGEQITDPLFAGSYEFYEFYLKRNLNQALSKLGNPSRIKD